MQRGRPAGNKELRLLRSRTWYLNVKSREKLSDCQLDVIFGTGPNQIRRGTADRIKVFEAIRVNGSIPASGTSNKRGFDLVAHVDSHPEYAGSAAILNSPFWRLMDDHQMSLKQIREMVVECIERLKLATEDGNHRDDGRDYINELIEDNPELSFEEYIRYMKMGDDSYDNAMGDVFRNQKPSLDYLALLGALAFEAIEAGNMQVAFYHMDIFRVILREYCEQLWLGSAGENLREYAERRMMTALQADALKGLPGYALMLSGMPGANPGSPVAAFLARHQRALWRK